MALKIIENVSLTKYSTMRLGGFARFVANIKSRQDVVDAAAWAETRQLPLMMIGVGSNIVWGDKGYSGLIMINQIKGFKVFKEDDGNIYLTVGAGEVWDEVVKKAVKKGLSGIEALSLIPGTAGATPVQNVGAYGQDMSQILVSVEAYDRKHNTFVIIPKVDCQFSYRDSRFKSADKGRFLITGLTLHLKATHMKPPFYDSLQTYLDIHQIKQYDPATIRKAVIAVRSSRLPDPKKIANNGSFFANPIVDIPVFRSVISRYPGIPHWPQADGRVKLSAAWMVELAGFKGFDDPETGMSVWPNQPLVLVNKKAKTTRQLIEFKQKIIVKVRYMFGVTLEQEPELIGDL
ncbi:MAG: UDP-N-acetylmuramate dehydrogenase [Candidatus Saccharibacteria bacterium]|nr:UDP-N-acetylmuramate dehydrogenase [Candidatus Saccharibacteria bacterium]